MSFKLATRFRINGTKSCNGTSYYSKCVHIHIYYDKEFHETRFLLSRHLSSTSVVPNFIDGEFQQSVSKTFIDLFDPATQKLVCKGICLMLSHFLLHLSLFLCMVCTQSAMLDPRRIKSRRRRGIKSLQDMERISRSATAGADLIGINI